MSLPLIWSNTSSELPPEESGIAVTLKCVPGSGFCGISKFSELRMVLFSAAKEML